MSALSAFANIGKVPELRRRIIFTVVLLAVYRIGVFVTIPGVDRTVMNAVIHKQGGGMLGLLTMFSGGAFSLPSSSSPSTASGSSSRSPEWIAPS